MSDYTPTADEDPALEDVRGWYIDGRRVHNPFASDAELVARFDRWLTQHDAEVAAKALRDHGKRVAYWHRDRSPRVMTYSAGMIVADLEEYAHRIEREAGVR